MYNECGWPEHQQRLQNMDGHGTTDHWGNNFFVRMDNEEQSSLTTNNYSGVKTQ